MTTLAERAPAAPGGDLGFRLVLGVIVGGAAALIGWRIHPLAALAGLLPVLWIVGRGLARERRRRAALSTPFPPEWRKWLEGHVPFYERLDPEGRARFEQRVRLFLLARTFEGVGGVEVTDDLRLAVAAGAAMLLHGRPEWTMDDRRSILLYPEGFDEEYLFEDTGAEFDGMVHGQGPVILSVPAVRASWRHPGNGDNVVLHELAHVLDFRGEEADGVPQLLDPASADAWSRLVHREMQAARLGKSLLRSYAATNPAEFFAVAVENFFERPALLRRRHPELYDALAALFNQHP